MGNWVGSARTNYFAVSNESLFREVMAMYEVEIRENQSDPTKLALVSSTDSGDWPDTLAWSDRVEELGEHALRIAEDRALTAPISEDTAKELIDAAASKEGVSAFAQWERDLALRLITSREYLDGEDDIGADFIDTVAGFLASGEIAVFMIIGSEGTRYLTGVSVAINSSGERVALELGDIYEKAKSQFGIEPGRAEY